MFARYRSGRKIASPDSNTPKKALLGDGIERSRNAGKKLPVSRISIIASANSGLHFRHLIAPTR
jgi:hypothetical protein